MPAWNSKRHLPLKFFPWSCMNLLPGAHAYISARQDVRRSWIVLWLLIVCNKRKVRIFFFPFGLTDFYLKTFTGSSVSFLTSFFRFDFWILFLICFFKRRWHIWQPCKFRALKMKGKVCYDVCRCCFCTLRWMLTRNASLEVHLWSRAFRNSRQISFSRRNDFIMLLFIWVRICSTIWHLLFDAAIRGLKGAKFIPKIVKMVEFVSLLPDNRNVVLVSSSILLFAVSTQNSGFQAICMIQFCYFADIKLNHDW